MCVHVQGHILCMISIPGHVVRGGRYENERKTDDYVEMGDG